MKKASLLIITMVLAGTVLAQWDTFVIRENSTYGAPVIKANNTYVPGATEFVVGYGNQKAGWGTNVSAATIGGLSAISIDRLDNPTRFTAGTGPAVAPYFNIWVTNGAGSYAVIANEPSNGEWQPGNKQWDMTWATLGAKTAKVFESKGPAGANWVYTLLGKTAGSPLKFSDVAGLMIGAPDTAFVAANYIGAVGTPRQLGTNMTYEFNWIFGDTLSNYVSGVTEGFVVANPTVIPEPATLALLGLGGLLFIRKK